MWIYWMGRDKLPCEHVLSTDCELNIVLGSEGADDQGEGLALKELIISKREGVLKASDGSAQSQMS